jgi:hypothetical protein
MLQNTVIPEHPMYFPEFPPQGALIIVLLFYVLL